MTRVIPECLPDEPKRASAAEASYRIETVTPLFGGGVEAGVNDPAMPVRGTAVRGQLQFWWRATRGAALSLADMRRRHAEVFGSTEGSSPLTVTVSDVQVPAQMSATADLDPYGPVAYALFPARDKDARLFREGLRFTLGLRWLPPERLIARRREQNERLRRARKPLLPDHVEDIGPDILTALWAWVNFGGLGARTRRGCGALRCDALAPKDAASVGRWLADGMKGVPTPASGDWPRMGRSVLAGQPTTARDAWRAVLDAFKTFRQGRNVGRAPGQGPRPGRSYFPEPETIRETLGANRQQSGHQRLPRIPADAFPRAELGLPIVFELRGKGEPPKAILYPRAGRDVLDRMASPLILKPLALADGRAMPLIVRLAAPGPRGVELTVNRQPRQTFGPDAIRHPRLAVDPSPLAGRTAAGSALEAFLKYATEQGFMEVTA